MNKCTECGHCCVVFTHVAISEFEAKLRGIKTESIKKHYPKHKGKKELRIKRKEVFYGPLGYTVFICYYFDLDTRLCSIYQNRPDICRKYNCEWDPKVRPEWEALIRGDSAQCLYH